MKRLNVLRAKLATGGKSKHGLAVYRQAATRWLYRHTFSTGDRLRFMRIWLFYWTTTVHWKLR